MEKRLYRSQDDRVVFGVCGGLARHFNIDPVIVRIIAALLVFANGIGILAYIIMAIIIPLESSKSATTGEVIKENIEEIKDTASQLEDKSVPPSPRGKGHGAGRTRLNAAATIFSVLPSLFLASCFC